MPFDDDHHQWQRGVAQYGLHLSARLTPTHRFSYHQTCPHPCHPWDDHHHWPMMIIIGREVWHKIVSTYQLACLPLTDFFLINSPLSLLWPITSHYHHHGSLKVGILNMAHYNLFSSEDLADFLLIVPKSERGGVLDRRFISSPYNGILR